MVIAGLAYALNEIIDSYQASVDDSFGHQMKVTFTITGFIFGGPLLFHLVDRIPTMGKSDLSAASLRYHEFISNSISHYENKSNPLLVLQQV